MKKNRKKILIAIIGLIVILAAAALIIFRHELKTLSSLKELGPGIYTMTYDGDYGFDEFLKTGAENDEEITAFVTKRLMKGLSLDLNGGGGCTAFVTTDENGDVIFGRNFDYPSAPFVQIYTAPDNGYRSVSTVNLEFVGYSSRYLPSSGIRLRNFLTLAAPFVPFDGINEKGVCISLLAVPEAGMTSSPDKNTLNTTTTVRLVLDKAASVDEAIELLKQYNIYFSANVYCHYLIADSTGKSVLVEYYDGELRVVETDAGYQIASNFIAYNDLKLGMGYGEFERYDAVEKFLQENENAVSLSGCEELLSSIGMLYKGRDILQWSVVYNISKKTGRIWPQGDVSRSWDFELK